MYNTLKQVKEQFNIKDFNSVQDIVNLEQIDIYTDGSCSGNPGPGSVAFIIYDTLNNQLFHIYSEDSGYTTNNREELTAVIAALDFIEYHIINYNLDKEFVIYTDSSYVYNIINDWMVDWQKQGWKRKGGKPIENLDLVQLIYHYYITKNLRSKVVVKKVKGHQKNIGNEIVDAIAANNMNKFNRYLAKI